MSSIALSYFHTSRHFSSSPLSFSSSQRENLHSLIKSCYRKPHLLQLHSHLLRTCRAQDPFISLQFLTRVTHSNSLPISYSSLFFSTQIPYPSVSHFNTIIRAHSLAENSALNGVSLYKEMRQRGVKSNPTTASFVIKCCTKVSSLYEALQVHCRILRDGFCSDGLLLTSLMGFYSSSGRYADVCKLFDELYERDTVSWNVLISCHIKNKRSKDALSIFDAMQIGEHNSVPDDVTCLLLLQACAHLSALEFGEKVHEYVRERGYDQQLNVCNALVTMYSRCGCIDKAYHVFEGIPVKNVVSWSAMISGLAMNGQGRDAVQAFKVMWRMGVEPDEQTFTGVLSACAHSRLIDEGIEIFESMKKELGLVRNIHHYGCMVDLLGRAGLLDKAYELIISMDVKPDSTIWRTLLGACRLFGHEALGELIFGHLVELKAQEAGDYVLLLNIYSSVGNWEKVAQVRKLMKDNEIQTAPGCSTLELKGKIHEFVVDDISHPRKDEIYGMLDEIGKQLKIAGYVAEISSELHNLDAEDKGTSLSYHSEKVAMAFGVLATPPGTTIRIAKNLRICVDCHNFAKCLSWVYNREVIIRDRMRFHHFRGGHCSCNDYW